MKNFSRAFTIVPPVSFELGMDCFVLGVSRMMYEQLNKHYFRLIQDSVSEQWLILYIYDIDPLKNIVNL